MNKFNKTVAKWKLAIAEVHSTATIDTYEDRVTCRVNNKLHNDSGPAVIWANGTKEWWVNGNRHRVGGPAIECSDQTKIYYLNGKRHCLSGPAKTKKDGYKEWWVNGQQLSEKDFVAMFVSAQ